jgi:hypothetical protein
MVRTLLIWLLALALPAQGVIAATMVFCGPNHHGQASAVAATHLADEPHQPHDSTAHSHDAIDNAKAENTASDETAPADKFTQAAMQKCSVCASCCSAVAIHDTVPKLPVLEPMVADFAALATVVEPFATGGPDRPPRHLLA